MKIRYDIVEDCPVVYINYRGSKIEKGLYECKIDMETLDKLIKLDRSLFLLVTSNIYVMYKEDGVNKYLHHLVLPSKPGYDVDHKGNDTLDNRHSNLRYLSRDLNSRNTTKHKVSKHGYKWVAKNRNKYAANVRYKMEKKYLGNFNTPLEAHRVANRWVYEHIGSEFCVRNAIKIDLL